MQLSSLSSIISAVLGAFNSEASSSSSKSYHFTYTGDTVGKYLTFFQNSGDAELCPSEADGYRNFNFYQTPVASYAQIPNDNNLFLDASANEPGAYFVTIGGTSSGSLSFNAPSPTNMVYPYIDGALFQFFYDANTPINHGHYSCYQLWVANDTAYSYGWTATELDYS